MPIGKLTSSVVWVFAAILIVFGAQLCLAQEPWHVVWSEADLDAIGKNTRVSSVSLDAGMVTKLAGHQQITHLRLVNANCLDDTSWAELVRLQNVVHLEVGINEAEPLNMFGQGLRFSGLAGLAFLAKFAKLETLVIYGVPQDEAGGSGPGRNFAAR